MSTLARVLRATALGLVALAVAACALAAHQGVRLLPVLTGSMTPWAPAGSLVLTVPVAGGGVAVGDVVAFRPPAPYRTAGDRPVMHRVASLAVEGDQPYLTTKGDANPSADPWRVATGNARFGRAVLVVPHVGRLLAGGTRGALGLGLGAGALLLAAGSLRRGARDGVGARGRRTVHRAPHGQTVTVALHVPQEVWRSGAGQQGAEARAHAALQRSVAGLGLTLRGAPERTWRPERDGVRLELSATAA